MPVRPLIFFPRSLVPHSSPPTLFFSFLGHRVLLVFGLTTRLVHSFLFFFFVFRLCADALPHAFWLLEVIQVTVLAFTGLPLHPLDPADASPPSFASSENELLFPPCPHGNPSIAPSRARGSLSPVRYLDPYFPSPILRSLPKPAFFTPFSQTRPCDSPSARRAFLFWISFGLLFGP